jgi:signal transduction histidine kinase
MEDAHVMKARLDIQNLPPSVPLPISTALYRITQEALRNVGKHTDPGVSVSVELSSAGGTAQLSVRDAGPGFDLQPVRSRDGIGLASMQRERGCSVETSPSKPLRTAERP